MRPVWYHATGPAIQRSFFSSRQMLMHLTPETSGYSCSTARCSPSYLYTSSLSIDSSIFIHISLTNPTHLCTPYCCPPSYPAKSKSNFPISLSNPNFLYSPMPAGLASTKHLNPMASVLLVPHSINLVPAPLPWCSGCVARRDNSHCGSECLGGVLRS